jgi:hypothetical protein
MPPLPRQQCAPDSRPGDTRLTTFVRFRDLVDANIVRNWPTLLRLIDEDGFPPQRHARPQYARLGAR